MIAREAVLNDPRVVELLKSNFVCLGVDNAANPNTTVAEARFIADKGGRASTEGMTVFTAGGKLLGRGGGFQADPNLRMLKSALEKYDPESEKDLVVEDFPVTEADRKKIQQPPEGGLVLDVTWKLLETNLLEGNSTSGGTTYVDCFADSLGVDHLWIRQDEADAIAAGAIPESVRRRISRWHLDFILPGKTEQLDLTLDGGRITGTRSNAEGDRAELLGFVNTKNGEVTRFDLVVKGMATQVSDCGFSAGLTVVKKGEKVPVALSFRLSDPNSDLRCVMPAKVRAHDYLQ
ncbi:MAG: hypothetical protein WD066_19445 [Planctomycetaceae bacterium]